MLMQLMSINITFLVISLSDCDKVKMIVLLYRCILILSIDSSDRQKVVVFILNSYILSISFVCNPIYLSVLRFSRN